MRSHTNNKKSVGLKGGPNEYITHVSDLFSIGGYKSNSPDVNNPYNIIQSGNITMEGVDFPVMGTDNLGNSQMMTPGNNYQFPGDQVFEVPMAQTGIEVPKRQGVRDNGDGSESTHLMRTETLDGENWFSFPTLFQNEDGAWVDMSISLEEDWKPAYQEALRRGEVIDFGTNKEAALAFGLGSWKNQLPKQKLGGISSNGDPTRGEAKRQQMLQSGQWTANSDGSLSRVKFVYPNFFEEPGIPLGLPSKERISELEHMNRPLTENERREYGLHAFDPSANANILFSLIAGASPFGAATDVLGGVASRIASGGVGAVTRLLKSETGRNLLDKVVDFLPEIVTDQALYPLARRNVGRESSTKGIWNEVADSAQKKRQGLNEPTKPVSAADPEGFLDTRGKVDPRAQEISVRHQDGVFESSGEWNPAIDPTRESGSFIASKDMQQTSKPMAVYRAPRQASSSTEEAANWEKYRVVRDGKESDVVINDLKQGDQVQSLSQGRVATDGSELYMPDSETKRGGRYVSTTKDPETLSFFNSGSKGESQYSADIGEITSNDNTSYFKIELPSGSPVLRPNSYRDKGDVGNYGMDFPFENEITLSPYERYEVTKIENQPLTNFFSETRKADLSKAELDELGKKTRKVVTVEPILRDFSMGGFIPKAQDGEEQGAISAYEEPAWYEKAFDRLASPMTTFGYSARNQDIPDNLPINMEDRNLYDSMIDVVNPFAWIKYGAQAKRDYDKDEYLNAGFNALGAIPIVPAWLAKGRNLKNAYKYNPFAYNNIDSKLPEIIQFNRENNNWIRQVGRSGIDDVQQTGVVREMDEVISPSQFNEKLEALRNQQTGITFSLDKRYNGPFFKKGETFFDYNKQSRKGYDGKRNTRGRSGSADYIIETKPLVSDDLFQPAYMDAMHLDAGGIKDIGDIGIMKPWGREADNFNYYKKDWWEGYKRTPLEKLQQGGSLPQAQDGKEMGITNELLAKQAYVESNWDPKIKNSLGYMGLGQIGNAIIADYKQKNNIEGELDPYDPVQNAAVQRWSMNELYNAPWINKEGSSPENRLAKTLAAYNWGRGDLFDMLTRQKEKGIDIYKGSEWLNDLPQKTQDYIKMITTDYYAPEKRQHIQENYLKALEDTSYSPIKSIYFKQRGGETYTIQSGDNLGKIAAQYNMDYKDLASFNNIADPNLIMPNQVLNIPDRETSTTSNTNQDISYRVKPGDSLSKIAKNYRTSVGELQRINNIENPNLIQVDQEILFPETVVRTPVEPTEPSWISTDDIKQRNDSINQLSDIDVVMKGQILTDPNERYIVIDKPNNRLKVYQGDTEVQDIEVILGKNKGDAQTVTKSSLANADQLMRIQEQLGIEVDGLLGPETKKALANSDLSFTPRWTTDYSKGNLSTGAGVYQISNTSPTSGDNYQNAPSFNMTNEAGIEVGTSIHGTPSYRLPSFGNDNLIPGEDENNRMSSGCINGKCTDLQALYDLGLPTGTSIYILPEDEGNKFELVDGKPVLRMSQENREAYKGDYTDEKGREQTGQGGNYTTETLTYKPIRAKFDKEKFVDERFTLLDFNDDEEFDNTTQPFISALEENKKEIMLAAKIPGDVYNQIAKMAFGIYGTESEFGDTHSWVGNAARGANKKFGSDGSSPDVIKKYEGFDIPFTDIGKGAQDKDQSVGYTQMRWTQLNDKEKTALESFGITSSEDFLDPAKSAIATATVLGIRYNEQLTADQKKDVWKHLPSKWNKRANYTDRVKNNSVYLNFEQLDVLKAGGEIDDSTLYRNYINGIYNGGKQEKQAEKVYDKLNRRHYWKAKAMDMSPSNYVLTYVVGQR